MVFVKELTMYLQRQGKVKMVFISKSGNGPSDKTKYFSLISLTSFPQDIGKDIGRTHMTFCSASQCSE